MRYCTIDKSVPLSLKRGFSLVELLAVMAVIAILLSLASVGVNKMGKSQGLTSGVSIAEGVFAQARSLAIAKGSPTRVVIHARLNDEEERDRRRYLKMMMIMEQEVEDDSSSSDANGLWKSAGQATFLPDQVYYSAELSRTSIELGSPIPEGNHTLGKAADDAVNTYYYEFNSQGICTTPGATFVLESGSRPRNSETVVRGKSNSIGGFMISRNGNTLSIRDTNKLLTES